jgi:hypothetical protein
MFPRILRRDILVLLGAKAVALTLIYLVFIAPSSRPEPDRSAMQAHLLGSR